MHPIGAKLSDFYGITEAYHLHHLSANLTDGSSPVNRISDGQYFEGIPQRNCSLSFPHFYDADPDEKPKGASE
jgi:hypothetical protein